MRVLGNALGWMGMVLGCPLGAEDARFGVQGALALPVGDLVSTAETGFQLGGHARWAFRGGHGLMARVDVALYGQKDGDSRSSLSGGADYTFHPKGAPKGFYFLGGLSMQHYQRSLSGRSRDDTGLGLALGLGYDHTRNLGFQARYTSLPIANTTLSALTFGVTYTF